MIGSRMPEPALQPLDLELLVPEHERDDHALVAGPGGAARNGARTTSAPRAGRSARPRRRRRRGCRAPRRRSRRARRARRSWKSLQRLLARRLAQVAVDRGRGHALALELRDELVGAALRAHEHHRAGHAGGDGGEHLDAVELVHLQEAVQHLVDVCVVGHDLVQHRVVHVAPHQHVDLAVERGGEQAASGGRSGPCA